MKNIIRSTCLPCLLRQACLAGRRVARQVAFAIFLVEQAWAVCPYDSRCLDNPYGKYGNPYSNESISNPYARNAPKIYGADGEYLGRFSSNPYDPESISNPYGKYGNPYGSLYAR